MIRAGSWSLRALRLESDCGPFVHICSIDLILVLFLLLPSSLRNVVYVFKKQLFCINCSKTTQVNALYVERGLPHLNINIVYSEVLKTLNNFDKPM